MGEQEYKRTYEDMVNLGQAYTECENLSWWEHTNGRLHYTKIMVEAKKSGDKVFALVCPV